MADAFDPLSIRQHPGFDHCISCTEDADYSAGYSRFPRCCCRSVIPLERIKSRLTDMRRDAFIEAAEMLRSEADRVGKHSWIRFTKNPEL